MNLDSRIKSSSDILTCFDIEKAKQFIGQKGYFAGDLYCFTDLQSCPYDTLENVFDNDCDTFQRGEFRGEFFYPYFIPESSLKPVEKKYRPYTIEEFCNEGFEIIVFRDKDDPSLEYHVRYNGYRKCDTVYKVILGNISYTLSDLFEDFEFLDSDGEWKPFGVEK